MSKEREIMRMYFEGHAQRDICAALRCGHGRVTELVKATKATGLTWEALSKLDDADICDLVLPTKSAQSNRAELDMAYIGRELAKPHVTRQMLWEEYCSNITDETLAPYQYSRYCELIDEHLRATGAIMKLTHVPGQRMFIDYAGDTATITDAVTGAKTKAYLFCTSLPYSAIIYCRAYLGMEQASFHDGHICAFEYFGGVPAILVPDHCATATNRTAVCGTLVNRQYYDFADYYHTAVVPARVRKPNDKALVENAVYICERQILGYLRNERFFTLGELNEAIALRVDEINARPFSKREGCRASVFETEERHLLKSLPEERYETAEYKVAKVSVNYHVYVKGMYYSVPYRLIGKQVDVRITGREVAVSYLGDTIASHVRRYGRKGQYSTMHEHMPPKHQQYDQDWSPERYRKWAVQIGTSTLAAIEEVLASKVIVEQAYVPCMNILNLAKKGKRDLLEQACSELMSRNAYITYSAVKNTMAAIRKRSERPSDAQQAQADFSDTLKDAGAVRGARYYGNINWGGIDD
jgi:transposase